MINIDDKDKADLMKIYEEYNAIHNEINSINSELESLRARQKDALSKLETLRTIEKQLLQVLEGRYNLKFTPNVLNEIVNGEKT
jgi:archaellum component FlaC